MAPSAAAIEVLVCSGNLGNAKPDSKSLSSWIPKDGSCREALDNPKYPSPHQHSGAAIPLPSSSEEEKFDLIVIGLQEATYDPNKNSADDMMEPDGDDNSESLREVFTTQSSSLFAKPLQSVAARAMQKSPVGKLSRAFFTLTKNRNHQPVNSVIQSVQKELLPDGTADLHSQFRQRLPSYKRKVSFQRGEMRLLVYVHFPLDGDGAKIRSLEVESINAKNTGKGGLANKGGIFVTLRINHVTKLSFITCHLEAHEGLDKYERRCESLTEILAAVNKSNGSIGDNGVNQCFILGDLNFRTRHQGHIYCEDQREEVIQLVEAQD